MLAAVAGISGVLGLALANVVDTLWQRSLPVPWSSVITVGACAVALAGWAISFGRRIRSDSMPVDPITAVRTAALSMAASRAGSIIAGLYAGIGLWFAADLSTPVARERIVICAVGFVASLALVVTALWLERICRLPDPDDDPSSEPPPDDSSADWVHPHQVSR
jgi:hypothetical protein